MTTRKREMVFDCKVCHGCGTAMRAREYWTHVCPEPKPYTGPRCEVEEVTIEEFTKRMEERKNKK